MKIVISCYAANDTVACIPTKYGYEHSQDCIQDIKYQSYTSISILHIVWTQMNIHFWFSKKQLFYTESIIMYII
jgi:hypothetical protein